MTKNSDRSRPSLVIVILALALAIASTAVPSAPSAAAPASRRATIGLVQEPRTLMPHFDLLSVAHETQNLAFECLLAIDEKGNYVPRLATEVPSTRNDGIGGEGRTYTFKIRNGAKWADGRPVTAEDVEFTWQVITNRSLPIPSRVIWSDVQRVEVVNPQTARLHFAEPNSGVLAVMATDSCFIMPKHMLAGSDLSNAPFHRKPLGSGPFQVQEWTAGSFIRLTKNPSYWVAGKPALDELQVRILPGTEGQRAAMQRGEVDLMMHLTTADLSFVERLSDYRVVKSPTHAQWQFWLHNEDPILSDKNVRQALAYGLDRATITKSLMRGTVEPMDAALPPSHPMHNARVKKYPYNVEQARGLLDRAGWVAGADGIRRKDGRPLRLEILNIAGQVERRQVIQIAQENWRRVGIDTTIREIDAPAFPPTMAQGNFQIAYGSFGERHDPAFALWLGTNWQRYRNERALGLLRRALTTVRRDQRVSLVREFQAVAAEDMPILMVAPRIFLNAAHQRLDGYVPTLSGSLWGAQNWQVK